jgi:pyruvate dehydrogenase E1 component alpha subunit
MHFIRNFELEVAAWHKTGSIKIPIYLGVGQESIASTLSVFFGEKSIPIFAQHRAHSYFLAFGGRPVDLRDQILSSSETRDNGAGGSASISDKDIMMFGHSGLMGDQVPIAVGYALRKKKPVLSVVGDASVEEDYVLASLAFAGSKSLPLLLVCEDNDLSILTPKEVRRTWRLDKVANAFDCLAKDISDNPEEIWTALEDWNRQECLVLNVKTTRHLWHAGSGRDFLNPSDTLLSFRDGLVKLGFESQILNIEKSNHNIIEELWK